MKKREYKHYVADFETTTYKGITTTEVWAAALVELYTEDVKIDTSIESFINRVLQLGENSIIYFHNLKFDGSFILDYLLKHPERFHHLLTADGGLMSRKEAMKHHYDGFNYMVSGDGQWYMISIYQDGIEYRFQDSLKLLPFSVKVIGKAFNTAHQKTIIDYVGYREANGTLTAQEKEYIANDVLVVKEALEIMFSEGHDRMTIGSCCMHEFSEMAFADQKEKNILFPDLTQVECPFEEFKNADDYIRRSYHGGWCYVKHGCAGKVYNGHGTVCDVNSLYPSVMHSDSGNVYPYGKPVWFKGDIPEKVFTVCDNGKRRYYYFVRVRTRFYVKDGFLPTIQIKKSALYNPREWLQTSDFAGEPYVSLPTGDLMECRPEMILTCTDWELLQKHYDLKHMEIVDGCYFLATAGMFDPYINKWAAVKMAEKGAKRTIAKLFLNNLYGKMAASDDSSYKVFRIENEKIVAKLYEEHEKKSGYIAVGSAITSYARMFTITAAQKNFKHFIYADTDSLHCFCLPDDIVGAPEHPTKFLHWKYESEWDSAIFARQKTYIEHQICEDREPCEPFYNIKCAGMGTAAKKNFEKQLQAGEKTLEDFHTGLEVTGNLKARIIKGGTLLEEKVYKMR